MLVREFDKCEHENSYQNRSRSPVGKEPWAFQGTNKDNAELSAS